MIIHDFKKQFNATVPFSEDFITLMRNTFGFYIELRAYFFSNLASEIKNKNLDDFFLNQIRSKLFENEHCNSLEESKKVFLIEKIKLEEFQNKANYQAHFLNDLEGLMKVTDRIYQLLQWHWELYKYKNDSLTSDMIVDFILEIDEIGVEWDSYLEKYLAISRILNIAGGIPKKEGFAALEVKFHLPAGTGITLEVLNEFVQFLQLTFSFILLLDTEPKEGVKESLEVFNLEVLNPIKTTILIPQRYAESYEKFLHYLSVDVLKKDVLLKFVMEMVRLQQGKEISKPTITSFHKKLVKQLEKLPVEGYLAVGATDNEDSVNIITQFCDEMDNLKIQYKDLFTGFSENLSRNRIRTQTKGLKSALQVPSPPEESSPSPVPEQEKTKVDVQKKEHIGFLTS